MARTSLYDRSDSMVAYGSRGWHGRMRIGAPRPSATRGMDPRPTGVASPTGDAGKLVTIGALFAALVVGCGSNADKQMYDPVALGIVSTDAPFYDDGETQLYQVERSISLPILS